jgi:DNA-binding FadR family transcriptional regulator
MDVLYHHVLHHRVQVSLETRASLNASLRRLLHDGTVQRDPDTAAQAMAQHLADSYRVIRAATHSLRSEHG